MQRKNEAGTGLLASEASRTICSFGGLYSLLLVVVTFLLS
jgi:hypothetical protein